MGPCEPRFFEPRTLPSIERVRDGAGAMLSQRRPVSSVFPSGAATRWPRS